MHKTRDFTQITIDTDIHDHHLNPTMPGENIDRRPSGKEIEHHLTCHRFGIGAYSLVRDSVIGSQGEDHLLGASRALFLANRHQAGRNLLQTAETSQGLGQTIQPGHGPRSPFRREQGHGRKTVAKGFPVFAVFDECHLPTPWSDP